MHVSCIHLPGARPLQTDLNLYFSEAHTLESPPNNSRLKNIEVAVRIASLVVVVSLAEGSTLRWAASRSGYPLEFIFLENKHHPQDLVEIIELLRFINANQQTLSLDISKRTN